MIPLYHYTFLHLLASSGAQRQHTVLSFMSRNIQRIHWHMLGTENFFIDSNTILTCSYTFRIHNIIKKKLPDSIKCKQSTSNGYCTVG